MYIHGIACRSDELTGEARDEFRRRRTSHVTSPGLPGKQACNSSSYLDGSADVRSRQRSSATTIHGRACNVRRQAGINSSLPVLQNCQEVLASDLHA